MFGSRWDRVALFAAGVAVGALVHATARRWLHTCSGDKRRATHRQAFLMHVNEGSEAEYERRHSPIWAELEATLREHGAHNYSIYLEPRTRNLFAYVEIEDDARWASVAKTDVCQRWWKYMSSVMQANADHSPVASPLKEVFHMD